MSVRLVGIRITHHVTIDIAASSDRIEQRRVNGFERRLQIRFDNSVQLHRLPRGQTHGAVRIVARDLIECKPLFWTEHAARNANADHEGEGLLHFFSRTLRPQVAIVLQIHAVEFDQLLVVFDDSAGDFLA